VDIAKASKVGRRGTRAIRKRLNCLKPNIQKMKEGIRRKDARNRRRVLCRYLYAADATSGTRSDTQRGYLRI
jgi:hypothetical protein